MPILPHQRRAIKTIRLSLVIASSAPALAQTQTGVSPSKEDLGEAQKIYSPYVARTARNNQFAEGVYWGDTHLHTSYSTDAGMIGNKLPPEVAYKFALGEEMTTSTGQRARLIRPLDFLVVADHAENLGLAPMIAEENPDLLASKNGRRLSDLVKAGDCYEAFQVWGQEGVARNTDIIDNPKMTRTVCTRYAWRTSTTTRAISPHSSVSNGPGSTPWRHPAICTGW